MLKNLMLIIIVLSLISCSSRKAYVDKSVLDIDKRNVSIVNVDGTYVKKNNIIINENADEIKYTPIKEDIPMIIDGKQYSNTSIKINKKNTVYIDSSDIRETKRTRTKQDSNARVKSFDKEKEVESNNYLAHSILLIVFLVIVFGIKKYFI